jgi:cytosine/adenosine deaminase-related metal-dependent hydrolase
MRGRVPPAASMPAWAARLIALRRETPPDHEAAIAQAIVEARACGTTLVGDVTNTLAPYDYLADSALSGCVFYELLGFNAADPAGVVADAARRLAELTPLARLRPSVVPHAPYSVSAALLTALAAASPSRGSDPGTGTGSAPRRVMSIHVGESAEEVRFLQHGDGPWRDLLTHLGAWNPHWTPPGCGPIEYLDRMAFLSDRLLAVHCVQLQDPELARLAKARATVVTCPRSNKWTGAGMPPIERFYASGVGVAIGTDSLAGAEDLNVFSELREARSVAPAVPASELLRSATQSGADALGFGNELGTIEPGKHAELIAVALPADVEDVEEYLLSGIQANAIRWLDPD